MFASAALALAFVPATPVTALAASQETVMVSSADALAAVSKRVASGDNMEGVNVVLTADIDMSGRNFVPIGSDSAVSGVPFKGMFSGQGHTIKNLTVYTEVADMNMHQWLGLFGETDGATVSDVKLVDADVSCSSQFSSSVALLCAKATSSTFENCTISGKVTSQGGGYESSFGGAFASIANTKVVNCSLSSVDGSTLRSGLVQSASSGSSIESCSVDGVINSSVSSKRGFGAIVGTLSDSSVSSCVNRATVTAHMNEAGYLGGIVGSAQNSTIVDSYNYGAVTCDNANTVNNMEPVGGYVAGVAGYVEKTTVSRCSNNAAILSDCRHYSRFEDPQNKYAAGIVSQAIKGSVVDQCLNTGTVTSDIQGLNLAYAYSAGAVCLLSDSELTNTYTTGAVTSTIDAVYKATGSKDKKKLKCSTAGLVLTASDSKIESCYALGAVSYSFASQSIFEGQEDACCVTNESSTFKDVMYWRGVCANNAQAVIGLTATEIADASTWSAWVAGGTWRAVSGAPVLSWQDASATVPEVEPDIDFSQAQVVIGGTCVYTGEPVAPKLMVTLGGKELAEGVDYCVTAGTDAGKATAEVEGLGRYVGSVSVEYTIAKANNGLKAKAAKSSVKRGGKVALKVSGAIGKVTYKCSLKGVSVKGGKVVAAKGAKKGTCTVTVRAAGDANHKAASVKVKFKVK